MSQETIEKKLAYLEETKHMIGDALITKGQTLDSETPFRDYVQKVLDIETGYDTRDATAVASEVLKGKTFYNSQGKVEGTLVPKTGDIKKFETIEEMNQDANAQEGDLAIVYRSEIQNATVSSQFSQAIFSSTIVLPEALTDYVDVMYRAVDDSVMFDCWGNLDPNYFRLDCYTETGSIRIQYESTDGKTYTRTDNGEELVDFGTDIYYVYPDYWNDVIGYFIQIGGNTFEGLYENKLVEKTEFISFPLFKDIPAINENYDDLIINHTSKNQFSVSKIKTLSDQIKTENTNLVNDSSTLYINSSGELISVWGVRGYNNNQYAMSFVNSFDYNTRQMMPELSGYGQGFGTSSTINGLYAYKLNLENMSYTPYPINYQLYNYKPNTDAFYHLITKGLDVASVAYMYNSATNVFSTQYFQGYVSTSSVKVIDIAIKPSHYYWACEYVVASTQLTLDNVNQLLPGKIAYGKNGLIEGDNTVWKQIPDDQFVSNYLGLNISDLSKVGNYSDNKALLQSELPIPSVCAVKSKAETTDNDIPLSTKRKISLPNIYSDSYIVRIDGRYFVLYYTNSKLGIREWFLDSDNNITEGDWVYSSTFTPYDSARVITRVYEHNLYIATTSHNTNLVTILKYDVAAAKITIEKTINVSTTSPVLIDINAATNTFWFLANRMGPIKSCNYSTGAINTLTSELNAQYGFYEHFTSMGDNYWMIVDSSTAYIMNRHTGELKTKSVPIDTYYGSTYTYYAQSIFEDKGYVYTIAQRGVIRYNLETDTIEAVAKNNSLSDGGRTYFNYFRLFEDSKYLYYLVHAQFTSSSGMNNYFNIFRLDTETLDIKQLTLSDTNIIPNACIIPELDEHNCINNDRFNLIAQGTNYHIRITAINSLFNADKPIIALSTGLYTTTDKINSIFEETSITPDEYQEALETAYSIRDDATE